MSNELKNKLIDDLQIRLQKAHWADNIDILIMTKNAYAMPLTMQCVEEKGAHAPYPTLTINKTYAQILMDDLWNIGIRPTEGTGSAGSLKATESHLDDMRKIAFKKLNIDQGKGLSSE